MDYLLTQLESVIKQLTEARPAVEKKAWEGTDDLVRQQILKDGTEIDAALIELEEAHTAFKNQGIANARLSPALDFVLAGYSHGLLTNVTNKETVRESLQTAYNTMFPLPKGEASVIVRIRNLEKTPLYLDYKNVENIFGNSKKSKPIITLEDGALVHFYATSIGEPKISCGELLKGIEYATKGSLKKLIEARREYILSDLEIPRKKINQGTLSTLGEIMHSYPGEVMYRIKDTEDNLRAKGLMGWLIGMSNTKSSGAIPITISYEKIPYYNCIQAVKEITKEIKTLLSV